MWRLPNWVRYKIVLITRENREKKDLAQIVFLIKLENIN